MNSSQILLFCIVTILAIVQLIGFKLFKSQIVGGQQITGSLAPEAKLLVQKYLFTYLAPSTIAGIIIGYFVSDVAKSKAEYSAISEFRVQLDKEREAINRLTSDAAGYRFLLDFVKKDIDSYRTSISDLNRTLQADPQKLKTITDLLTNAKNTEDTIRKIMRDTLKDKYIITDCGTQKVQLSSNYSEVEITAKEILTEKGMAFGICSISDKNKFICTSVNVVSPGSRIIKFGIHEINNENVQGQNIDLRWFVVEPISP